MSKSHVYIGRGRTDLRGRSCRIVATWRRHGPHNVLVEFIGGERVVCPMRTLRRSKR